MTLIHLNLSGTTMVTNRYTILVDPGGSFKTTLTNVHSGPVLLNSHPFELPVTHYMVRVQIKRIRRKKLVVRFIGRH